MILIKEHQELPFTNLKSRDSNRIREEANGRINKIYSGDKINMIGAYSTHEDTRNGHLKSRDSNRIREEANRRINKLYAGDKINMIGAYSTHEDTRNGHKMLTGNRKGRDHTEDFMKLVFMNLRIT
jgi:ribosome-associated protein YbcJ (S4-like RNA binding protein)